MNDIDPRHIYHLDRSIQSSVNAVDLGEIEFNLMASAYGVLEAIKRTEAVIEFDPSGKIITANKNFLDAMGYTLDEIAGQHHRIFVQEAYAHSQDYRDFWSYLSTGKHLFGECLRVTKSGKEIWLRASYNPVVLPDGTHLKVVKVAQDITPIKQRYLDTEKAMKNLRDMRMDEISDHALTKIEESSREIRKLITLIEEIASRTNLLGINAEIEASHAREEGRGFSVVAQEIRRLAGRSSHAVDDIGGLIEQSARAIESGRSEISSVADKAAALIEQIVKIQSESTDQQCDKSGEMAHRIKKTTQAAA